MKMGEGLVGSCAEQRSVICVADRPPEKDFVLKQVGCRLGRGWASWFGRMGRLGR